MNLIKQIQKPDHTCRVSRITGNDASRRHNTTVWVSTDTRDLVLKWRESSDSKEILVGAVHLDLQNLVEQGHCKREGRKIRFTIYHDDDRWLRVRIFRAASGGVELAKLDW
jgi:hypothetical protein